MESEDDSSALQTDLDILSAWVTRWDMEFNPSKCQVVHVTGSRKTVKTDYVLHAVILLPAHPASFAHKFLFQRVPMSPGMQ